LTLTKKVMEQRIKLAKRNPGCSLSPEDVIAEQNPKLFRMVNDAFQKNRGEPTLWEFYEQNDTCRQEPEI